MIRELLPSALCICLSPLLVAQQAANVNIPKDTKIELVSLERVSSQNAIRGATVRFAVARDVAIGGVLLLPAGTPVSGIVTKVDRGVAGKRAGSLRVRIREIAVAENSHIRLTNSDPKYRQSRSDRLKEGSINTLETIGAVALLPLLLPMAIGMSSGGDSKPDGRDAVLPRCWSAEYWVAVSSPVEISPTLKTSGPASAAAQDGCVTGQEKPVIDWTVSSWEVLAIE
jgi:hypothetical protein